MLYLLHPASRKHTSAFKNRLSQTAYDKPLQDSSRIYLHICNNLSSLVARPNKMNAPTTGITYNRVFVLLTSWENDDEIEDVERDIPELQCVFERDYNYHCKRYSIPAELSQSTPQSALRQQMEDFALMGTSKDLLIFYYAGHGLRVTEPEKKAVFELQYEILSNKSYKTVR